MDEANCYCYKMDELEKHQGILLNEFEFVEPSISDYYKTVDPDNVELVELGLDKIGYSFEYWPNPEDWTTDKQKDVWFDVKTVY